MKKSIFTVSATLAVSAIWTAALAQSAFAHGVEKMLPADASNVRVAKATLEPYATGETLISDDNEGPKYNLTYTTMLNVMVKYDSKDTSDDATALDDQGEEQVVGGPLLSFYLPVTDAQVSAIQAKTLDPTTLVSLTVAQQSVKIDNPVYTSACQFDDNGQPLDSSCIQDVYTTETRPVLDIDLK